MYKSTGWYIYIYILVKPIDYDASLRHPPPPFFYQVVVKLLQTQFDYSSNMAFPDNIYLRVLMFVCSDGTTLSKRDSPLHDSQHTHTVCVLDKYKNKAYWRSDSINIYHNHKIKIFFKPIDCNLIGCCFSSGRVLLYFCSSPLYGLTIVKWSQWKWLYFFLYIMKVSVRWCVPACAH